MNIIVPINVAALRVSPSTAQTAKTALYDFSAVGESPLSVGGNLIAAERFLRSEERLNRQPGIHLHWSLPKAYTQGAQSNADGKVHFPALPNRWLIARFFKNVNGAEDVSLWILESDAHAAEQDAVSGSPTTLPWMDAAGLCELGFHYAGRRIPLGSWREPGSPASTVSYLGGLLTAPLAYGETFTAYYQHSRNLFGIYDDLADLFPNPNQLELDCRFSVSYSIAGWTSPRTNDVATSVLASAVEAYQQLPEKGRSDFSEYIHNVFEEQLRWKLDDYAPVNLEEAGQVQGVLSGIVSSIEWNITTPGNPTYPSDLPDAGAVHAAVGNNTPEALSAYLASSGSGSEVTTGNIEWLLNALQFGQLPYLGDGELGIGQLDQYLHARSFGSTAGGYLWSVRTRMTPGAKAATDAPVEVTLPVALARLLSALNCTQAQLDSTADEIATRRQKLFFDWCYHVKAIQDNVVQGNASFSDDVSKDYLLDGLLQLFQSVMRIGSEERIPTKDGPSLYLPASFRIAAPPDLIPGLSAYAFQRNQNDLAASVAMKLLDLFCKYAGEIPAAFENLRVQLGAAQRAIRETRASNLSTSPNTAQAVAAIGNALTLTQQIGSFGSGPAAEIAKVGTAIGADATSFNVFTDPVTGIFARYLAVQSVDSVPAARGEVYRGTVKSLDAFENAGSWNSRGDFQGIRDLLDRLTGQGDYAPHILDAQQAAIHSANAYFWRTSGETASHTTAYALQLALKEIASAQADGKTAVDAIARAVEAIKSNTTAASLGEPLKEILNALTQPVPDLVGASARIDAFVATAIPAMDAEFASASYQSLLSSLEIAWRVILNRLPLAHQVSILSTCLDVQLRDLYEIDRTPARPYWQPNEPVLLLTETSGTSELVKPVNRNGDADLLPCRLETEIVQTTGSIAWPKPIGTLPAAVDPGIPGLAQLLQRLLQEAWLLCPDFEAGAAKDRLRELALENRSQQYGQFHCVKLAAAPACLTGTLPYFVAWDLWAGTDPFLPLFLFWQANFAFSKKLISGKLQADFLDAFQMDRYLIGYQPIPSSIQDFQQDPNHENDFDFYGVATLSSSSNANLCEQIRQYCLGSWNYDPGSGPPKPDGANYEDEKLFYDAYSRFRTLRVLSQGLGGFNATLLQRAQELQLPVNIPESWVNPELRNLPPSNFWPSQFLLDQSAQWPANWSSLAIDFRSFAAGEQALPFNPLRAGFLQLQSATLVDAFGRFVKLSNAASPVVAESLQSEIAPPDPDHPVYLAPRIVEPSRLLARWISASSPDGLGEFVEWNPHPAASPICGWLVPNHLDGALAVYNGDGTPLGSLRQVNRQMRWFTTPGEAYPAGIDNRALMLSDLTAKQADPELRAFLETFVYPDESSAAAGVYGRFLDVLDRAQQFILTKSMQEDQSLALLIGQPLVLARCSLQLQLHGLPNVSLDSKTYMPWNKASAQFQMDGQGYMPYNFANFYDAGLTGVRVPVRIGAVEYRKNGMSTPYFDDGVAGFFLNSDYHTLFTPVDIPSNDRIRSTGADAHNGAAVMPGGAALTITLLLDPRASTHLTSGILPMEILRIPPDQYTAALNRMLVTFLTAPVLRQSDDFRLPVPRIAGYDWNWWQVGLSGSEPVQNPQAGLSAVFPNSPLLLADGWLQLKRSQT